MDEQEGMTMNTARHTLGLRTGAYALLLVTALWTPAARAAAIDVTNPPGRVMWNVGVYQVAGMSWDIVGTMWVTNERFSCARVTFPAAENWTAPPIPLGIGPNSIRVYGTNDLGVVSSGSVRVWRYTYEGSSSGSGSIFKGRRPGPIKGWGDGGSGKTACPPSSNFVAIAAGASTSYGLTADGHLLAWGADVFGSTNCPSGTNFVAVAAGENYGLALDKTGRIYGWGNMYGFIPNEVDFLAIGGSSVFSIGLRNNGSLVGWGQNTLKQIDCPPGSDYVAIAVGGDHSLALRDDGRVVAWGSNNYYGQTNCPSDSNFVAISAGMYHSIALKRDGTLVAWGEAGARNNIPAVSNFVSVAEGLNHILGSRSDGTLVAWGLSAGSGTPPTGKYLMCSAGSYYNLALTYIGEAFVDVTSTPITVTYDVTSWSIAGTNNMNVVGTMLWSNMATLVTGVLPATPGWSISAVGLAVGPNELVVSGTDTFGAVSSDSVVITRGAAGTGVPFLDITNSDTWVTYDVASFYVAGTNNANVIGIMNVANETLAAPAQGFAAAESWQAPFVSLAVGPNVIAVYGTNCYGVLVSNIVTITRGPAGTGVPFVDVTNADRWVSYDVTSESIGGSNNINVVGVMIWSNSATGARGTLGAATGWQVSGIVLAVGANTIVVSGTNAFGALSSDSAVITRGPAGTGVPCVDVTNASRWVSYDVTTDGIAGTNNLNVVGTMQWSNTATAATGTLPAALGWALNGFTLAVGANTIVVNGTNAFGVVSSDSVVITRGPAGTGAPFLDVTTSTSVVIYDFARHDIAGTNNLNVVGSMVWTNGMTGDGGSLMAATNWRIASVALAVGANTIMVSGTNQFGISASDTVTITRGVPSTATPYVDVTNANQTVIYDFANTAISGSNNIGIVALWWSNSLTGIRGTLAPGSPWWTINGITLNVGVNVITVYGTNALNVATSDSVTIIRGNASTATPFVDVTNTARTVTHDVVIAYIGGSNNLGVVALWWSNSLTSAGGTLSPGSPWWTISGIALNVGVNVIIVYGTNALNVATSDSAIVTRGSAGTGVPYLDVTNTDTWVTFDRADWAVAGTNNVNVVGRMNVLNTSFGGTTIDFPSELAWATPAVPLGVGANTLLVRGTNAYGAQVSDNVTITRGPAGTGVPFTDITSGYVWVTYDVTGFALAGTNNLNVVGDMRVLNSTVGGAAIAFPAGLAWTTPQVALVVGTNALMVFGTNAYGTTSMDSVVVVRGPAGTGVPFVDATNVDQWVSYDISECELAGTNCINVVGTMWWTNSLTGAFGTFPAAEHWTVPLVNLAVGANMVTFAGTNMFGVVVKDTVVITRGPVGTGMPFVDATNEHRWVTHDVTTLGVAGTNNVNVVGIVYWSNSATAVSAFLPAAQSWQIAGISLAVGLNAVTVVGTNAFGTASSGSATIIRGSAGTGVAYLDVTNLPATVTYNVMSFAVAGTNNVNVVGTVQAVNAANGSAVWFDAATSWTAPALPLLIGTNVITVTGTNAFDQTTADSVTIIRGPIATVAPYLDITNALSVPVNNSVTSYTIAGTNNPWVAGLMWWANTAGGSGSIEAMPTWRFQAPLAVGVNAITVYGTNLWSLTTNDSVVIIRLPGAPADVRASDGTLYDKVRITFAASQGAAKYIVYRASGTAPTNFAPLSGEITTTTYDDTTVAPGVTYYYAVQAGSIYGWSALSTPDTGYAMFVVAFNGSWIYKAGARINRKGKLVGKDILKGNKVNPPLMPYFLQGWQIGMAGLVNGSLINWNGPYLLIPNRSQKMWQVKDPIKGKPKVAFIKYRVNDKKGDKLDYKLWTNMPVNKVIYILPANMHFGASAMMNESSNVPPLQFLLRPAGDAAKNGWQILDATVLDATE
jgi:hypothetical protein